MVKFSKELEAQLIPEWKDAFLNYWQLKKHIKKIKLATKSKHAQHSHCDFGRSIFDPIRSLAGKISAAAVHKCTQNNQMKSKISIIGEDEEEVDETEHAQLFSEEYEVKLFFEILDDELKKVNEFYTEKESEFVERGELLNKQLQILLNLKRVLSARRHRKIPPPKTGGGDSGVLSTPDSPSWRRNSDFSECGTDEATDDVIAALEKNGVKFDYSSKPKKGMKPKITMRIDIPATTPARTISAVTSMLREDLPKKRECINTNKIQSAEKMIRGAFVELYRGLGLLKTYSSLNMVAFTKILKKFDKVSNQQASADYLKRVKRSDFITSDKVVRLMDEVESLFTEHYTNNDRKKAMKFLRPLHHKDSHLITFFVGLFTGSFVTLFCVYAILAHISGMFSPATQTAYMETVYPIFSMFALLSLHLFMYGCNLLMWKNSRINYNFIFEFQPSNALKYRDAFLICTSLMTAVVGALVLHLVLLSTGFFPHEVDLIPGILLLCALLLLVCPLNVFYRPTRYCFLRVIRNIICSPFYKVLLVDFFMADQLTSQIPLLRHLEAVSCYLIAGGFKVQRFEMCKSGKMYRELAYVISFAPYYWRAMQCARRWFDESNPDHLANLGKYVSAMMAAGARLTYARQPSRLWLCVVLVTSVVASIYQMYWDFVKDWGLLNRKSKNPWLRDDLVLKNTSIYYISIALNFVLRILWVEAVIKFNAGTLETHMLDFFLASMEVIRRGHWNYYRLENEHLHNAGKFRAVKTVPLPFKEMDSE
ncbi:phosphate transporter PHO1-like [Salvia miltiorrhiza]|uniref:phosphate transporter PHO1-like n=1 Tax=Salvia miltiorrhiza TaxID=226208 RepID=UPI0025AD122B|nr:phosphate transporter PHO1-like [Salvia miltiorrhiza]